MANGVKNIDDMNLLTSQPCEHILLATPLYRRNTDGRWRKCEGRI